MVTDSVPVINKIQEKAKSKEKVQEENGKGEQNEENNRQN